MQESISQVVSIELAPDQGLRKVVRHAIVIPSSISRPQIPDMVSCTVVTRTKQASVEPSLPLLLHLWQQDSDGHVCQMAFENRLFHNIRYAVLSKSQELNIRCGNHCSTHAASNLNLMLC